MQPNDCEPDRDSKAKLVSKIRMSNNHPIAAGVKKRSSNLIGGAQKDTGKSGSGIPGVKSRQPAVGES